MKFGLKYNLKDHLISIHALEKTESKKGFQCLVCHRIFNREDYMKKHVEAVHEKKKPFHCSLCQAKFGYKQLLKKHLISNHDANSEKKVDQSVFYPVA